MAGGVGESPLLQTGSVPISLNPHPADFWPFLNQLKKVSGAKTGRLATRAAGEWVSD